jgi:L-arabinokinase
MRERRAAFSKGARIMITSAVPKGKGVSSSAALEVATMMAVAAAFDISISPIDIVLLCQKVENLVVGAACGVMDQMTSVCAEADQFLRLRCQPAILEPSLAIPEGISFIGIDSGIRHSVSGSDYTGVRVGAFMGYRMIAEAAGLNIRESDNNTVQIDDPNWRGYLANISPSEFEQCYSVKLPESIRGREFLNRYKGTTDAVTRVDPERAYAVNAPTAHPIYENFRVETFAKKMSVALSPDDRSQAGELMYQSHASYSACGLGSWGTDLLVEIARNSGLTDRVYGAKITGGGGGGTVVILCDSVAVSDLADSITDQYYKQTGYRPYVFRGTSMGAAQFGHLRLTPAVADHC